MKLRYFLIFLTIILAGCTFDKPVVFKSIQNTKVENIDQGVATVSAELEFYNPNEVSGRFKKGEIVVFIGEDQVANISRSQSMNIAAQSSFSIPVEVKFSIEDVQKGLLSNLLALVTSNSITLHFKGDIVVGKFIFTQKVPVDYEQEVKLRR